MRRLISALAIAALALVTSFHAEAQTGPLPNRDQVQSFVNWTQLGRSVDINATTASFDEALVATGPVVTVWNTGTNWGYVSLTNAASSVTAATGIPVGPGACAFLNSTSMTHIQAVTATGGTILQVSAGWGNPGACGGGGGGTGGGGGAVFGPTAVGGALSNPPVVVGGSQNGTAGGLVSVWKVDSSGLGYVNCANCSSSGVSAVDQSTFTAGTSPFAPAGGVFNDSLGTISSGTQATARITGFRAQHVNLRNNSGIEVGTSTNPVYTYSNGQVGYGLTIVGNPVVTAGSTNGNATGNVAIQKITAAGVASTDLSTVNGVAILTGAGAAGAGSPRVTLAQDTSTLAGSAPGTAGSPSTSVVTVQGASSMTPVLVNPGNASNWGINTQGSTTAGQSGTLMLGAVTTSAPTYTTAQSSALSLTPAGALRVDGSGTTQPVSIAGNISVVQPTPSNLNATVFQLTPSNLNATVVGTGTFAVQATQSGTWTVQAVQSGSWSLAANQSVDIAQIGGNAPLTGNGVSGTGSLRVNIASDNTAFAVNAVESGTWNINNISGTISLPTGAATSANQPTNVAIGTTTSGQTGHLMMGAVTTASPAYTTAQSNALSLTTAGALRVDASAGGAVTVAQATPANLNATVTPSNLTAWGLTASTQNGATPTNAQLVMAQFNTSPTTITSGNVSPLQIDANGNLKVNIISGGGSGGTSSTFGAAFPGVGTAIGMSVSGNMVALTGTGANLNVQCANCTGSGASAPDQGTFTAGASTFAPGGGFFQTTATANPLTNGQWGTWQMTANRAGFVNLRNSSGAELGVAAAPLQVSLANTGSNATAVLVTGIGGNFPVQIASGADVVEGTTTTAHGCSIAGYTVIGCLGQVDDDLKGPIPQVTGPLSAGTAVAVSSLMVGGQFQTTQPTYSNTQQGAFLLSSRGELLVAPGVSGFAVNANPITAQGSTTAGTLGNLVLGAVTTSSPTYTTGQNSPFSLDTAGNLRVNVVAGGAGGGAVFGPTASGSASVNPPVQIGGTITGAAGVNVAGIAVKPASTQAVATDTSLVVQINPNSPGLTPTGTAGSPASSVITVQGISGGTNVNVNCVSGCTGSGGTSSSFAAAFPATGTAIGVKNGANMVNLTADGSSNLNVNCAVGCSGGLAQGSTTSGQLGNLSMAAVTTAAPTYTTAQTNALSMDTLGNLRVSLISGFATSANQASQITQETAIATVLGTQADSVCGTSTGTCSIPSLLKYLNNAASQGTGATGSAVPANGVYVAMNVSGNLVGLTGTGTALNVNCASGCTGGLAQGSTTSGQTGGLIMGAVTSSAPTYTTATTNALSLDTAGNLRVNVVAGGAGGGAVFGPTASGSASANPPVQIGGTITGAAGVAVAGIAVKPASTQAVATDTSLVVQINPNSPGLTPTGTAGSPSTSVITTQGISGGTPEPVTAQASENHVGETGSNQIKVDVGQTVTAAAYSSGNAIGGLMSVAGAARVSGTSGASGTGGILSSLMLDSKSVQSTQVDIFIFDANPTASTCTDKTAFVLAAADASKVVGVLTIPSTAANGAGWFSGGTGSLGIPIYYPITYSLASSTTIYGCAVARGAFTPTSTTDVSFKWNMLRN